MPSTSASLAGVLRPPMISVPAARWVPGRLPGLPAVEAYFCPGTVMAGLRPIYKTLGEPPGSKVNRHRLSRPSLKITRQRGGGEADAFVIEVWTPSPAATSWPTQ
jgi:hypothetical protein